MANNIKGITIEIEGNTTGLEKALKNVNSEARKTQTELNAVNKSLKFNPGNADLIAQKQKLLANQIATTSDKLKQLKAAEKDVQEQVKTGKIGEDKYRAFQREIIETESKLKLYNRQLSDVQTEQEKMGQNTKRLETFFESTKTEVSDYSEVLGTKLTNAIKNGTANSDDLEKALSKIGKEALGSETDIKALKSILDKVDDGFTTDQITKELDDISTSSDNAAVGLEKVTTAVNAGNLMKAAEILAKGGEKVKAFANQAQESFREVDEGLDIITSKTGQSADLFIDQFNNLYSSIAVSDTGVIGSALGEINTQLDFTGDKLEKASEIAIKYAEINGVDVSRAIMSAKSAIEAYGLSSDDFGEILDSVTATGQRTGVSVDKLVDSAVKGAPQIKALGLSFEQGVEMLGQFEKAGVDGEATLTALSKATTVYAKEGKTLQEGLQETINKIKNSQSATEAHTEAARIFGTKGASRMVDAIKRGALSFDNLAQSATDSSGTVVSTYEEMLDPIDQQQIVLQALNSTMAEFGAEIAKALQPILEALIPLIKNVAEWFQKLPDPVKQGVVVFGMVLVAISALLPIIAALGAAAGVAGLSIGAFMVSMLPIVGTVVAIGAAIAAVIAIFLNWEQVVAFLTEAWALFKANLGAILDGITSGISTFVEGSKAKFKAMVTSTSEIWENIKSTTAEKWESIKTSISTKISAARDAIKNGIDKIKGFFNFKITWPKIPMPRFSVNPPGWQIGDLLKGKIPTLGIDFYAKGGIMTKPTVFGMNGNNLMVGGEAGNEAILPLNRDVLEKIGAGIASVTSFQSDNAYLEVIIDLLERILSKDNSLYIGDREVAQAIHAPFKEYDQAKTVMNNRMKGKI